jgi:hypothetical protein
MGFCPRKSTGVASDLKEKKSDRGMPFDDEVGIDQALIRRLLLAY